MFCRVLSIFVVLLVAIQDVHSTYVITSPRKWISGAQSQTCISLTDGATFGPGDSMTITVTEPKLLKKVLIDGASHSPTVGDSRSCMNVTLPNTDNNDVTVDFSAVIGTANISQKLNIVVAKNLNWIFLQTDKSLYKPGQTVQFRILTLSGPFLDVATKNYSSVYVDSPKRTRIAQWLNVDNKNGLVHLKFDLHNEVDEGLYLITVQYDEKTLQRRSFKVEDYVLPKYELTITPPPYILGSDKEVVLELCAKYTFGQPVKGTANLSVAIGSWKLYNNVTLEKPIDGCAKFTYNTTDLRFDDNNCHIRISNLRAFAKVVEAGTENEIYGDNQVIRVNRQAVFFTDISPTSTRKQHLPSVRAIRATYPDKKLAAKETVEVCTHHDSHRICKNFTTDVNGELEVLVSSEYQNSLEFNAVKYPKLERNFNFVMEESKYYDYGYSSRRFSDTHNSSISIFMEKKLSCEDGKPIKFNLPLIYVVKNQPSAVVHLQGISRGQVQFLHSQNVDFVTTPLPFDSGKYLVPLPEVPATIVRGVVNIPVTLPTTVSPKIKILAWFKNADGVVFADSASVDVTPCLQSSLKLEWSKPKAEPGSPVDLVLTGDPASLCSIGVVDKSVELLTTLQTITASQLVGNTYPYEVRDYEGKQQTLKYCVTKYGHTEKVKKMRLPVDNATGEVDYNALHVYIGRHVDVEALHAFNDAGLYVLSDLDMEKEFCNKLFDEALKKLANQENIASFGRPPQFAVADSFTGGSQHKISQAAAFGVAQESDQVSAPVAASAPSFAADKEGTVAEEPTQERVYFPETWLWDLSVIPSTGQLMKSQTLPDTITEWVGRAVCVNTASGVSLTGPSSVVTFTPFFADLTLPPTVKRGEILPVVISVFNYQNTPLPVTVTLEASQDHEFVTEGTTAETGKRTICIPANDKEVVSIKIKATLIGDMNITIDAATNAQDTTCNANAPVKSDRLIRSIPVEAEGFLREKTWNRYICAQDYAAGEVIPAISIETPTDIVVGSDRSWVTAIGDLLGPSLENLGNLIRFPSGCGEQNMLNLAPNVFILQYLEAAKEGTPETIQKLKDFMSSGYQRQLRFRHSNGAYSTFGNRDLSGSTWLTAFVMKSFAHAKKFIFIDDSIQKASSLYLMGLQEKDGCFESKGRVIHKALQGGIGKTNENSLLTAYVTAAFIESQLDTPENSIVKKALPCIKKSSSKHPYNVAVKTYAMALANDPEAKASVDGMIAAAVSNSSTLRWEIPDQYKNSALAVETASYALMAMLICDQKAYADPARKVVRWLTSQRNGQGGFTSTQDTVVALQALAYFERVQPTGKVDLALTAKGPQFDQSFIIQETNKFLQQRFDLPSGTTQVALSVQGTGCTLAQGVLRYNVLTVSKSDAFTVTAKVTSDKKCKFHTINACASYTLPDIASNMAIIEVNLMSGFTPVKEDLKIVASAAPFKRYEVHNSQVLFYLDEITATQVCASFKVYQEVDIGNLKPGSVRVYDYYQPEFLNEIDLSIPTESECQAGAKMP